MIRNMDLVRDLLKEVGSYEKWPASEVLSTDDQLRSYHLHLLIEAGLIEGKEHHTLGGPPRFIIDGLSWNGQEFLAASACETRWQKLKSTMGTGLASIPFPVLTRLLSDGIEQSLRNAFQGT